MRLVGQTRRSILGGAATALGATILSNSDANAACDVPPDNCTTVLRPNNLLKLKPAKPNVWPPPNKEALIFDPKSTAEPNIETIAGLRPHRDHRYRLELDEATSSKIIIHNYGHSGAGITMSWGSAFEVRSIICRHKFDRLIISDGRLAIMGAGVMGLTAAYLFQDQFPKIKINIYSDKLYQSTTSHVAGGQWYPSAVKHDCVDDQFKRILKNSFRYFERLTQWSDWGVSRRTNYTVHRSFGRDDDDGAKSEVLKQLIREKPLQTLPFDGFAITDRAKDLWAYETLLVEPPIFLAKLYNFLNARKNIKFIPMTFCSRADAESLGEKVIINCTGLGAVKPGGPHIFGDPHIRPVKGQLALLPPNLKAKYLFSGYDCPRDERTHNEWYQYIFPRQDHVVIGGTHEEVFKEADPDRCTGEMLVRRAKDHMLGNFDCPGTVPGTCAVS